MPRARPDSGTDNRLSLPMLMRQSFERPRTSDWVAVLAQLPLFSRCGKRQLRRIAAVASVAEFLPGDTIVQTGERGDAFYLLLSGRAQVRGPSRKTLGPGDFFGEMALLDGGPRSATVVATSEVQAMALQHRAFKKVLADEPQLALAIMSELAARVRRLERARVD